MIHAEVLPEAQRKCLMVLGPAADALGFYLAGGTAVALQLGHRRSIDFDWFTPSFPMEPVELAETLIQRAVPLKASSFAHHTLHGEVAGIKVAFLEFRPERLSSLVAWPECGMKLASLEDLAAMKLLAVAQRGTKKDFIDVHALGARFSLAEMIVFYQRKFSVSDVSRVLAGLSYFDDAEPDPMPVMLDRTTWEGVKADIRGWLRGYAAR